jgi:hypothetical protein
MRFFNIFWCVLVLFVSEYQHLFIYLHCKNVLRRRSFCIKIIESKKVSSNLLNFLNGWLQYIYRHKIKSDHPDKMGFNPYH